jgi:predicted kinase
VVLRSDEVRKQLAGVAPLDHLPPAGYARDMSARVYATLTQRARRVLAQGHSVIVDAVYQRADDRGALARLAVDAAVPFTGLWLEAPDATLMARVEARVDDPSDADASVIRLQRAQAPGAIDWHRVDASAAPDVVLARASDIVAAESRPSSGRDDRRD